MKKALLSIFSFVLLSSFAFGQSFSDDFDAYTAGDFLAQSNSEWTTWGGTVGTSEDVRISDEQAASGANSIRLLSTSSGGGPQDLVKYFTGAKLTTGVLTTRMKMLVETGAYFNYQGEVAIGTTWSMNAFFEDEGRGTITGSGNGEFLSFEYPMGEWFDFNMTINFDANKWQLEVNGVCVGSFSNPDNSIASIDLFPLQGNSFYIDDFGYDYSEEAVEIKDDASTTLRPSYANGLTGSVISLNGTIANGGSTIIESFEAEATIGADVYPVSMDGLALANGESMDFMITDSYELTDGFTEVNLSIKSVNGGSFADEDRCNDESNVFLFGTTAAENKAIVIEEATGTWCGWCPRGTVALERYTAKYGHRFIGIAVHSGDPMEDQVYNTGLAATAYPNAVVNRGPFVDPGAVEAPFLDLIQEPAAASMVQGAAWNPDTRELSISMSLTSLEEITPDHKVNVAITEDDVTGTGSGYIQANYYAGGSDLIDIHGVNWAELPANIPASEIDYDHVARAILAPYSGMPGSFEEMMPEGEEKVFNFTYTVPAGFNIEKMNIVSMLINPDGTINNGMENSVDEAVENGFVEVTSTHDIDLTNATNVFPNPFSDYTNVRINLSETTDVNIQVLDLSGRLMMQKMYPNQSGLFDIQMNGSNLPAGMYVLKISTGDKYTTQKISIAR